MQSLWYVWVSQSQELLETVPHLKGGGKGGDKKRQRDQRSRSRNTPEEEPDMTRTGFQPTEWEKKRNLKDTDQTGLKVIDQTIEEKDMVNTMNTTGERTGAGLPPQELEEVGRPSPLEGSDLSWISSSQRGAGTLLSMMTSESLVRWLTSSGE